MSFLSPYSARERILAYGEPGVGKSRSYIDIAKMFKLTKTPAVVRVIDNDRSALRMSEGLGLEDYLDITEVYDWEEYVPALKAHISACSPNDFLVADLMDEAWTAVQTFYTEQIYGDDIGNYFLSIRKLMAKDSGAKEFEGWTDWKYINKLYFDFSKPFAYKSPCHVLAISTASPVNGKLDDKQTVSVFGPCGFSPQGQKRLKHQFNTTLLFHKGVGTVRTPAPYLITSVKDRERELITGQPVKNFALDYLKGIAGWTLS